MPGLLRTRLGLRSRLAFDQSRTQRRSYVINGTKTWITAAQWADWIFVLARTDREREEAGRHLVHPGRYALARSDACVPSPRSTAATRSTKCTLKTSKCRSRTVSENEGAGWTYAKFLLEHERTGTAGIAGCRQCSSQLITSCASARSIDDRRFDERIAEIDIELTALAFTELRVLAAESAGKRPGPESSILKLRGTEIQQALTELALDAGGPYIEVALGAALLTTFAKPRSTRAPTRSKRTSSPNAF